jgi:hypothetical protein
VCVPISTTSPVSKLTIPLHRKPHLRACTSTGLFSPNGSLEWRREGGCVIHTCCLRSHVAMHDSPPLALPAHCTPGVDGRHRERHRQDQQPRPPRRVLQKLAVGASCGRRRLGFSFVVGAVALEVSFSMASVAWIPLQPMVVAAYFLDFTGSSLSSCGGGVPVPFYSWHGMETVQAVFKLGRHVRRLAKLASLRPERSAKMDIAAARDAGVAAIEMLVGARWVHGGEKNLGMCVVRSVGRK